MIENIKQILAVGENVAVELWAGSTRLSSVTASGDGGSIIVSETITDGAGNKVDEIAFRNHYDGGDTPEIPRTGQLWWPVLAMLPAGALLIVVGFVIRRREDEPEEDLI